MQDMAVQRHLSKRAPCGANAKVLGGAGAFKPFQRRRGSDGVVAWRALVEVSSNALLEELLPTFLTILETRYHLDPIG